MLCHIRRAEKEKGDNQRTQMLRTEQVPSGERILLFIGLYNEHRHRHRRILAKLRILWEPHGTTDHEPMGGRGSPVQFTPSLENSKEDVRLKLAGLTLCA